MDNRARNSLTTNQWTRTTFWGWLLGIILIISLSSLLDSMGIEDMQFYLGLGMGVGVGLTQWLQLKKLVPIGPQWIVFSALGMGVPFIILDAVLTKTFIKLPLGVALGAIAAGSLQFLILKKYSEKASLWIGSSAVGWTVAVLTVLAVDYTKHLTPYISSNILLALINLMLILSGGIILGVITGFTLKNILKENAFSTQPELP